MDDPVALVYVGDSDGNVRYAPGFPRTDITRSTIARLAEAKKLTFDEVRAELLAFEGVWRLPDEPESATIEVVAEAEADLPQAPGEAAPDVTPQPRRKERSQWR